MRHNSSNTPNTINHQITYGLILSSSDNLNAVKLRVNFMFSLKSVLILKSKSHSSLCKQTKWDESSVTFIYRITILK